MTTCVLLYVIDVTCTTRYTSNLHVVVQFDILAICFFFNDTATTEIYTLSLHDALPISLRTTAKVPAANATETNARATCTRSEEHTSELQSRQYLVCRLLLEKKKNNPISS